MKYIHEYFVIVYHFKILHDYLKISLFLQKVLIQNASVYRAKSYNKGNIHYELSFQNNSKITTLATYDEWMTFKINTITFLDIKKTQGFISNTLIFKCFFLLNKKNLNFIQKYKVTCTVNLKNVTVSNLNTMDQLLIKIINLMLL